MSLHELKKGCKIVDEIVLYLMKNGHRKLNVNIDKNSDIFLVEITTDKCEDWLIEKIENNINKERELEVEEYGWELMGESDAQSELGLVGLLVDRVEVIQSQNETKFKLIRKDKY